MKPIPSLFLRHPYDDRFVIDERNPACKWVFQRQGTAYELYNGEGCLIRENRIYKRYVYSHYFPKPNGFISCQTVNSLKLEYGWLPVSQAEKDKPYRDAFETFRKMENSTFYKSGEGPINCDTFELVGPGVKDNIYQLKHNWLISHKYNRVENISRIYKKLLEYFYNTGMYGLVFYKKDGSGLAKIKYTDFIELQHCEFKKAI